MGTDKDYQKKKKKVGSMALWPLFMDRIDMSPGYVPLLDCRLLKLPPKYTHTHTHTHIYFFEKNMSNCSYPTSTPAAY